MFLFHIPTLSTFLCIQLNEIKASLSNRLLSALVVVFEFWYPRVIVGSADRVRGHLQA